MDNLDWSGIDVAVPDMELADCPACIGAVVGVVAVLIVVVWSLL